MKRMFVESNEFREIIRELGIPLDAIRALQDELLDNPEKGSLIPRTAGARKVRMSGKGKGKSGGYRVMYVDLPKRGRTHFLYLFDKSEADNLTATQAEQVKAWVQALKRG